MNKKIFFGIISITSIAGIFVACGSGTIDPYAADDQVAQLSIENSLDEQTSLLACQNSLECQAMLNNLQPMSSAEPPPPSSSSVEPVFSSSSVLFPTSSSSLIIIASSSSSILISSSSMVVLSSSSITPEGALPGTCAPSPAIAELGQTVSWTFAKDASVPVTQVIAATFDWTFEGGSIDVFSGQGAAGLSKSLTYSTSGQHTTTLSTNGAAPITCTPVQVNGAKITGCKCAVDDASPDVAKGGEATWTVSGCTSTATITGYTWNGGELGAVEAFTHIFAEKDETFAPTVTVSNDDNTVQAVICPTAKAIDATLPDYEMTASGNTDGVTFEGNVDATIVMNLPQSWHNGTTGTCTFACQVDRGSGGSGAISGTVDKVAITGSDYVTASIPITSTISGYALKLVVDVGTNAGVTCFVNW